jgi:type IV pilus assembly protein PilM
MSTRTRNVALALPTAAVITKVIIVPAGLREEELQVQVESEANQYIPFALEEVNLDFQVIGPAPSSAEEVQVLIAASRREKVDDRVAVAEAAGLKSVVMDVENYAVQLPSADRAFPTMQGQNVAWSTSGECHEHYRAAQRPAVYTREQVFETSSPRTS